MENHIHLSGMNAIIIALYIVVIFGSLHLLAASFPENKIAQSWFALGF